jgi:hypothetical protein
MCVTMTLTVSLTPCSRYSKSCSTVNAKELSSQLLRAWSTTPLYQYRPKVNWSISTGLMNYTYPRTKPKSKALTSRTLSSRLKLTHRILRCSKPPISNKLYTMIMPSLTRKKWHNSALPTHHHLHLDPSNRITCSLTPNSRSLRRLPNLHTKCLTS